MKGVLLLAHGTPERLEQMPEYLARVRGGQPASPALVEEMRRNYAAIGGRSPLTDITRAQAEALARELGDGAKVYVGMRTWAPEIAEAVAQAVRDGVQRLVALPMAPQYSTLSVEKYRQAVLAAAPPMPVVFVNAWHLRAPLVAAFAEKLRAELARGPADLVLFTAHSLPERVVRAGDPYATQVAETAAAVARAAGVDSYGLAYQSAGRTPEPWLGPTLEAALEEAAGRGQKRVVACPVGFVCDHTEILFDIDVQARGFARERGLELRRTESLNTSPALVQALAEIVRES